MPGNMLSVLNVWSHLFSTILINTIVTNSIFQVQKLMFRILTAGTAVRGQAAGQIQALWCWSPHTHCTVCPGVLGRVWVPVYVNVQHISLEGAFWKVRHQPSLLLRKKTLLGRVLPYFNLGGLSISNTWELGPFLTKWLYFLQFCSIVFGTTHKVRAFFAQRNSSTQLSIRDPATLRWWWLYILKYRHMIVPPQL